MMLSTSEDRITWQPELLSAEILKEYGSPDDTLQRFKYKLPIAIKYLMSIPESIDVRICKRENWPEENNYAYMSIPFDVEKNEAVEEIGGMKLKTGVVMPDPEDPNKCIITTLDKVNLKYMPNFALKRLMRKAVNGKMFEMVKKYKASATYAQINLE